MAPKRVKNANSTPKAAEQFTDVAAIQLALKSQSPDAISRALTTLRNQLTVKGNESALPPQDERIAMAKKWLEASPGVKELFGLWDTLHQQHPNHVSLILAILSNLLQLSSFHSTDYAFAHPIIKTVLTASVLRRLSSYIGGSNNELILVTLKLYNCMSNFARGRERKLVLEHFPWELKSLPKLFNMRRHGSDDTDPILRPDIRTLYILLLLSFVEHGTPTVVKTIFFEQHRDAFLAIFKGLNKDHRSLIHKVLESCWVGIWLDAKLKRTVKIGLFGEVTIGHLMKLYERTAVEGDEQDRIPADLAHHFLLAICTRPGTGICFKDQGWYPKEAEDEDVDLKDAEHQGNKRPGRIYNKILANVLKTLKVNEDSRQQELALRILSACPELVAGYWPTAPLTLEPRLSSKWITNVAFFGNVISLPVPSSSFRIPNSTLNKPTPPPLSTIVENILPSVNTKFNFTKGLQSPSPMVQHCTALALSKCLLKYEATTKEFDQISKALEEDDDEGLWMKRRKDIERECGRKVPEFQVIVAFSQQRHELAGTDPNLPSTPNPTKGALLAESSQRLLWLYHRCLPSVVASTRFDAGKALQTFINATPSEEKSALTRLRHIQQLHTLNLLRESDQFVWTSKTGSTNSPLYILLQTITQSSLAAIQWTATTLLQHVLSNTILFQDDVEEPYLWLSTLPPINLRKDEEAMEVDQESSAHEEGLAVIAFLEDSIQRCLKTPYRYIEDLQTFVASCSASPSSSSSSSSTSTRVSPTPSPLIITVIEQLQAKLAGKHLTPVQALGVVSYLRRTLYLLAGKITDLSMLAAFGRRLEGAVMKSWRFSKEDSTYDAVRRELDALSSALSFVPIQDKRTKTQKGAISVDDVVQSNRLGERLISWIRTNPQPRASDVKAIFQSAVESKSTDFNVLLQYVAPGSLDFTQVLDTTSTLRNVDFAWLYLHSRAIVQDPAVRDMLASVPSTSRRPKSSFMLAVTLIVHSISATQADPEIAQHQLHLLARVLHAAKTTLLAADYKTIQEIYLGSAGPLRDLLVDPRSIAFVGGIDDVLSSSIDFSQEGEKALVADISQHWVNTLDITDTTHLPSVIALVRVWLQCLPTNDLLSVLEKLHQNTWSISADDKIRVSEAVLRTLLTSSEFEPTTKCAVQTNISLLLSLLPFFPQAAALRELLAIGIQQYLPLGLSGISLSTSQLDPPSLRSIIQDADERWPRRSRPLQPTIDASLFIKAERLDQSSLTFLSTLAYIQPSSRTVIRSWLQELDPSTQDKDHTIAILYALLDSSSVSSGEETSNAEQSLGHLVPLVLEVLTSINAQDIVREQARRCLSYLMSPTSTSATISDTLASRLKNVRTEEVTIELLDFGVALTSSRNKENSVILEGLMEIGLQWFIDQHSAPQDDVEVAKVATRLTDLVNQASVLKPHLVETVLTVVTQYQLPNPSALDLATACIKATSLKPVVINRYLQNVVQSSTFVKICTSSLPERLAAQDALIRFVYALFLAHPNNTCQVTHVEPLIRVYRGTLSKSDLALLDIFRLFEQERKISTTAIIARWSSTSGSSSETALDALRSLDPTIMLRTSVTFPLTRTLSNHSTFKPLFPGDSVYDPVFIMLLFSVALQDGAPTSNFAWVELLRTNVVGMIIRALSSKDESMRELGLGLIAGLWSYLENADLHEKPHVTYHLQILKNLIRDHTAPVPRLPSYTTLLLMHALRGIFYPSHFTYPLTARFLLQRPELDPTDVPMLYGMLYNSSDDWKKERTWIIRFISDGMMSTEDWRVLKRRHTWDLLASLYSSSDNEEPLRRSILEVLAGLTSHPQAAASLVLKSGLLPWIEVQLTQSTVDSQTWLKILENILIVVDPDRIERSTSGTWRPVVWRCLSLILDGPQSELHLPLLCSTIVRLAQLGSVPPVLVDQVLLKAFSSLLRYEEQIDFTPHQMTSDRRCMGPYRSVDLFQPQPSPSFGLWGDCVEHLWQTCMSLSSDAALWSSLTQRLLIKHSNDTRPPLHPSLNASPRNQWIRKEIISIFNDGGRHSSTKVDT